MISRPSQRRGSGADDQHRDGQDQDQEVRTSTRYQMYIDGKFVNADERQDLRRLRPRHRGRSSPGARGEAGRRGPGRGRGKRGLRRGLATVTAQERGRILLRLAEKMRARRPELAEIETLNSGKPIVESEYDLTDCATCFEYYGGLATKLHGEVLTVPDNAISLALREPLGRGRPDHPLELPAADGRLEAGARHLRRLHHGASSPPSRRRSPCSSSRASSRSAACPRAWSTWSPASGRARRAPSWPTRTWTRSRSPASPRSARSSCGTPPTPRRR